MNPVAALHEHLQRYYKTKPNVTFGDVLRDTSGPPERVVICTVEVPSLADGGEPNSFQGEGRGKKDSKSNACAAAWEWLQLQPLPERPSLQEADCWAVIASMTSSEGLQKDRELRAAARWALQYNQRVLPLPMLLHSKQLHQWASRSLAGSALPGPLLTAMQQQLAEDPAGALERLAAAGGGVTLSPDGWDLLLPESYGEALLPLDEEVSCLAPRLVKVPADLGSPITQLQMAAGGDVLSALAAQLGVPVAQLVYWGRLGGRKVAYVATPQERRSAASSTTSHKRPSASLTPTTPRSLAGDMEVAAGDTVAPGSDTAVEEPPAKRAAPGVVTPAAADASLSLASLAASQGPAAMDWQAGAGAPASQAEVRSSIPFKRPPLPPSSTSTSGHTTPNPSPTKPAATPRSAAAAAAAAGGSPSSQTPTIVPEGASAAAEAHTLTISEPALYCKRAEVVEGGGPLNLRASWLAGAPVQGDVLLSLCGLLYGQEHYQLCRWRDYPLLHCWTSLSAVFPEAQYLRATPCPLVTTLPAQYSPSTWPTPQLRPTQLLDIHYTRRHSWRTGSPQWQVTLVDPVPPGTQPHRAGDHVAALQVTSFGTQQVVATTSGPCWTPEEAKEQAALAALHQLAAADAAALRGTLPPAPSACSLPTSAAAHPAGDAVVVGGEGDPGLGEVEVLDAGVMSQRPAGDGVELKVDVVLYIPHDWLEGDQPLLQPRLTPAAAAALAATPSSPAVQPPGEDLGLGVPADMDPELLERHPAGAPGDAGDDPEALAAGSVLGGALPLPLDSPVVPLLFPGGRYLLGVAQGMRVPLGTGTVLPGLQQLVESLHPGAHARARVNVCLQGADPFSVLPRQPAMLEVLMVGYHTPRPKHRRGGGGGAGDDPATSAPAVFNPSLARQRQQVVLQLVQERRPTRFLDAGCGDGTLLRALLSGAAYTPLQHLVGCDTSISGLRTAGRRIDALVAASSSMVEESVPGTAAGGGAAGAGGAGGGAGGSVASSGARQERETQQGQAASSVATQASSVEGLPRQASVSGPHSAAGAAAAGATGGGVGAAPTPPPGTTDVPAAAASSQPPSWSAEVTLVQVDLTHPDLGRPAGWGALQGVDMVSCMEVLEHLNNWDEVQAFTSSVLGGIQPSCAVFSTPNWEYNAVLRALPSQVVWLGPPGRDGHPLRHPDHKFEWDRAEFDSWAAAAAAAHGYQVEVRGVGRAVQEQEAAGALQAEGGVEARGCATQVAIFTREVAAAAAPAAAEGDAGGTAATTAAAAGVEHRHLLRTPHRVEWGPKQVTVRVGSLTGPGEVPAGAVVAPEAMQVERF